MSTLIEPTAAAIKQVFDAAFIPSDIDEDGDVRVKVERFFGFVTTKPGVPIVKVMYQFGSPHATENVEVLRALNDFNMKFLLVKAYWRLLGDQGVIRFETDFRVDGGLSPISLVQTLRQVESIIMEAKELHAFVN